MPALCNTGIYGGGGGDRSLSGVVLALNEGRGVCPGDTRCWLDTPLRCSSAQRRPGRLPRRHPTIPTSEQAWTALNEGRGVCPGDTA